MNTPLSRTKMAAWKDLSRHFQKIRHIRLKELFEQDPGRGERFSLERVGLYLDYSKNHITDETIKLLLQLAKECKLRESIDHMFRGEKINVTQNRPALHIALRTPINQRIYVEGTNIILDVHNVLDKMVDFSHRIRNGKWLGYTGKPIKNVINIGIGGSDLGPAMAYQALRQYSKPDLRIRFISNVDSTDFVEATNDLDAAETLFIISSKTFTTLETMTNANTARQWILAKFHDEKSISRHFVAVSTNVDAVTQFGIDKNNMFVFWDWVGGRYSLTSAIGLSLMVAIGPENFLSLLDGFHAMDMHFLSEDFENNLPVIMGLLSVWYNNFFGVETVAILPYSQSLSRFPAYLQQLTMESNGKVTTIDGTTITDYQTSPIYWGEPGTNSQHSFFQLLHQGTRLVPCDFIGFIKPPYSIGVHHEILIANMFAQAEALAFGKTSDTVKSEGVPDWLVPHKTFQGNRPSNIILANELNPETLGKLIALYEHLVFTQGVIWNINSFDQWGVELGKELANRIYPELVSEEEPILNHDSSTNTLIKRFRKFKLQIFTC